jgi:hypothetical protein
MTPSQFVQGTATIVANALLNVASNTTAPQKLLGDGTPTVDVEFAAGTTNAEISLLNAGSSQLAFTTNIAGHNGTVPGGSGFSIPLDMSSPQIDIQVFDPANPTTAWTITISQAPRPQRRDDVRRSDADRAPLKPLAQLEAAIPGEPGVPPGVVGRSRRRPGPHVLGLLRLTS